MSDDQSNSEASLPRVAGPWVEGPYSTPDRPDYERFDRTIVGEIPTAPIAGAFFSVDFDGKFVSWASRDALRWFDTLEEAKADADRVLLAEGWLLA